MTTLWDEELAWRCLPRPLPELEEIEQRLIEILVARGAVLDGEAGGRVQLMLAVDQLLATGIALQHQLALYEDIDDS